jgi:hypothetical protein
MSRILLILSLVIIFNSCSRHQNLTKRVAIAKAGDATLYLDDIPGGLLNGISGTDSSVFIQNYIARWAKKELMFQRANANLTQELKNDIEKQLNETRMNLSVYEYERQLMLQKMDTVISDEELEKYYVENETNLRLTSNIVKALFIKIPAETPNLYRIKILARSENQKDQTELESLCYQFAEKFDDFNEQWVTLDRLSLELKEDISNQENFLRRNKFYESSDSSSVYLLTIYDYRLRGAPSPFEYVRDDIKRVIWNNRRIKFIQDLENGIYEDALKDNILKIY